MLTHDLKIPTAGGRPVEAFAMSGKKTDGRAFLLLPGRGYTINHFLLDFLWQMAAEKGFYAIKAEYRGYTYRHLDEPYDHKHAAKDIMTVLDYLTDQGFALNEITVCAKSLGTLALANLVAERNITLDKVVLLTPVVYIEKEKGPLPVWTDYNRLVRDSYLVFGGDDPYCDQESAAKIFPAARMDCYQGADHGLHISGDYKKTIEINTEIIEKVRDFISK